MNIKNACDIIFEPCLKVMRMHRVNVFLHLILFLAVLAVTVVAAVIVSIFFAVRDVIADYKATKQLPEPRKDTIDELKNTDTLYYVVKSVKMSEYCLTQHIKLYIIRDDKLVDVTRRYGRIYPFFNYYTGKSEQYRGTIIMKDYDIIRFQNFLGTTKFVETVE